MLNQLWAKPHLFDCIHYIKYLYILDSKLLLLLVLIFPNPHSFALFDNFYYISATSAYYYYVLKPSLIVAGYKLTFQLEQNMLPFHVLIGLDFYVLSCFSHMESGHVLSHA